MAKTDTEAAVDPNEVRAQMWVHEGFVEWAKDQGVDLTKKSPAEVIAWFAARRNAYRKTEFYRDLKSGQAANREAERAARAAAAAAKKAAAPAKKAAAKKAPAKKAAVKAPAKRAPAKRATAAATTEENPFV